MCENLLWILAVEQVKAMNEAVDEDEEADIEDVDADSRRFLREVGTPASNATAEPWRVGQAGQQVGHPASMACVWDAQVLCRCSRFTWLSQGGYDVGCCF